MIEMLREREIRAEDREKIFSTATRFMKSKGMSDKDIDDFRKFLQEESHS